MNGGRPHSRRHAPIAVLAGAAIVPAVLLAGVWQYADANVPPPTTTTTTTTPPPPVAQLATDLLSWRRHPTPLADRAADAAAAQLRTSMASALLDRVGTTSCVRIVGDDGVVLVESGSDRAVVPASNQKLLVAAAALELLGPDYVFRTELRSERPVDGVVPGDVYLVGGGDPLLVSSDIADPLSFPAFNTTSLDALADQLVTLGISSIAGDVVGDASRYDDEFRVPEWGESIAEREAGPYDALLVNDSLLTASNYGIDPARVGAATFLRLLEARGIEVDGAAANFTIPAGDFTTLALVESRPLRDVLVEMLHTSDNNTAEMLVKEIGLVASGEGSRAAGLAAVRATLERWGMPTASIELRDGSGLSRDNRLTCQLLTAVLGASPVAATLRELLPAAGRDGTLRDQLLGTPAEGQMLAKTGTLSDVKALAGMLPDAERRTATFAIVLNAPGADDPAGYLIAWESLVRLIDGSPVEVRPEVERFAPLDAS